MDRLKKIILVFLVLVIANDTCMILNAQKMSSAEILGEMDIANRYYITQQKSAGMSGFVTGNTWERSFYYEGLSAFYSVSQDSSFLSDMLKWGTAYNWELPGGNRSRDARDMCCGQTYIYLYLLDRYKEERIDDTRVYIDAMLSSDKTEDWKTTDDLQMAMPVFAALGKVYDDKRYYDRMDEMYEYTKTRLGGNGLYNEEDHLWFSDSTFLPPYKGPDGKNCYWSRGNGWVLTALVRTIENMPNNSYRRAYIKTLKDMIDAIVPLQRSDGFWNVSLKDPDHFEGKEVTGTALILYGIAWVVNNGEISRKEYTPVIEKGWEALIKESLHPDGSLGYVQGEGGDPGVGQSVNEEVKQGFEDVAVGSFLLAGSEVYRLAKSFEPKEKKPREPKDKKKPVHMNYQRRPGGRGHTGYGGNMGAGEYPGRFPGR